MIFGGYSKPFFIKFLFSLHWITKWDVNNAEPCPLAFITVPISYPCLSASAALTPLYSAWQIGSPIISSNKRYYTVWARVAEWALNNGKISSLLMGSLLLWQLQTTEHYYGRPHEKQIEGQALKCISWETGKNKTEKIISFFREDKTGCLKQCSLICFK